MANELKNDSGFYENASQTARNNFKMFFCEEEYKNKLGKIFGMVYSNSYPIMLDFSHSFIR